MSGDIIEITDDTFEEEVIRSSAPVLVDFWASWCGPCMAVAPMVEEIAKQLKGQAKVCKVNVDDNQKIASERGIMSIPTFVIFKSGEEKDRIVGALDQHELLRRIQRHIE